MFILAHLNNLASSQCLRRSGGTRIARRRASALVYSYHLPSDHNKTRRQTENNSVHDEQETILFKRQTPEPPAVTVREKTTRERTRLTAHKGAPVGPPTREISQKQLATQHIHIRTQGNSGANSPTNEADGYGPSKFLWFFLAIFLHDSITKLLGFLEVVSDALTTRYYNAAPTESGCPFVFGYRIAYILLVSRILMYFVSPLLFVHHYLK